MRTDRRARFLGATLATAMLAACTSQQIDNASNAISSASPAFVNDALITAQIEGYFLTIDPSSAVHVTVSSQRGVVHLGGTVKSATVRERFVARARSTPDVKRVVFSLRIDPRVASPQNRVTDFTLAVAVEASLATQAGLNALPVHVDAHAGVVTLSGTVRTAALRTTILDAARHTGGVRAVRSRLKIGA